MGGGGLKRHRPRSYLLSHFGNGNALGAEKERQVSVREINRGDSGLVLYLGAMGDNRQISRLVLLEVTILSAHTGFLLVAYELLSV